MDKEKEEVSKSLDKSNNSKGKKKLLETTSDQEEEQQAAEKRFKTETTTTHCPNQRLTLLAGSEKPKEEALVQSLKGSSKDNLKFVMNEDTDSEEESNNSKKKKLLETSDEAGSSRSNPEHRKNKEIDSEELSVISPTGSSDSCTSTFRTNPTDKLPDSDKDESKRSPPVVLQGSSCKKNL